MTIPGPFFGIIIVYFEGKMQIKAISDKERFA